MKSKKTKSRILILDLIRSLAIILVVLCHSVEGIYAMNLAGWNKLSIQSGIVRTIFFTMGRLGVPLFLFLTGFLLLNKNINSDEDVKKFYKHNLLALVITTEIWILIYNIFISINNNQAFNYKTLIKNMLFIEQVQLNHMWYMPAIIGIYIAIPFVNKSISSFNIKSFRIPIIVVFILIFVRSDLNAIKKMFKLSTYGSIIDINFLGGVYGIYVILGYMMSKGIFKRIKSLYIFLIALISFVILNTMQICSYQKGITYNVYYHSALLLITSICLFELLSRINVEKMSKKIINICTYISKISLAIFFVHKIFQLIICKYVIKLQFSNPIKVVIVLVTTLIISILTIMIVSKIKIVKEKVFLIKE